MGLWRSVTGTAGAKVAVMGLAGLLGIVTSRLIIEHFGVASYAQYGLLNGLRNLLPFADLGIGAVVINAIAEASSPRESERVHRTLTTALRVLTVSGLTIAAVCVAIQLLGWWPLLLGDGLVAGGDVVATLCLVVFGLSLPLGIGIRVLIGLKQNVLQTFLQGIVSPLFFVGVVVLVLVGKGQGGDYVALVSYVAAGLASAITVSVAARLLAPQVGRAFRDVPRRQAVPGVPVAAVAVPMLVQSVAMPVAMQSDRLLLSHLSTTQALAQYTFATQLFGLVMQAIIAAGVSMWPYFAQARARDEVMSPFRISLAFLAGGVLLSAVLALCLPFLQDVVADGKITVPLALVLGYCALVAVQALNYPPGMYMTDERGLRFQVVPVLLMTVSNVALSWVLIEPLGAAGPVVGSAVAIFVFQVVPNSIWVARDLRARRRAAAAGRSEGAPVAGA
ncbi:Membrane protein involved in the export of O-antigen and teichoic acid [Cellulosimicrobium cellulans]|nr:Membrane protein involved in the export of O-antigen and teichoic acid [Cellulosimicrobium cellulans]